MNFENLLMRARQGDKDALERLLLKYQALINKNSYINGVIDEDLQQYIYLRILISIKNFSD